MAGESRGRVRPVANERVYVAVGDDVEESKSTLLWALRNFGGHFRILHVHQPDLIDDTDDQLSYDEVRARRELQTENLHKTLDAYIHICNQAEVHAESRLVEMSDIGKGIVELIELHAVEKLVMGAAADVHYSETMTELKSAKAMFVDSHADPSCQIWYTCGGHLICMREGDLNAVDMDSPPFSVPPFSAESNARSPQRSTNSSEVDDDLVMVTYERGEMPQSTSPRSADDSHQFPSFSSPEALRNDEIYNQFEREMIEAEKARRNAFERLMRRIRESENNSIEAIHRARAFETLYKGELRHRKELERILAEETHSFKAWNEERDEMMRELHYKIIDLQGMLETCKKERDDLLVERDRGPLSEFSFREIQRATDNFEPSMKIGEGGYWMIYRGFLHHTQVAVKLLQSDSPRAPLQLQQELDIMTKLRHPSIVTLIGVCSVASAIVYEHLPNGSLEDRLLCRGDTAPLSYQTRIRIASEVCSALIFLHTNRPRYFVHGDLRPGNILLDANFAPKLCGFGWRPVCHWTDLKPADFPHVDPHYFTTGELYPKSDVYSFGIILLQLLTGRAASNLVREMEEAVCGANMSRMKSLLDPLAGEWPITLGNDLVHLALSCCCSDPNFRPNLRLEVWTMLKQLRTSHAEVTPASHHSHAEEDDQVPDDFLCPISHEIMKEPTVAADGHTYDAEAVRGWLNRGHNTSPMTNLHLPHLHLYPNLVLRSVIQKWLANHPQYSFL